MMASSRILPLGAPGRAAIRIQDEGDRRMRELIAKLREIEARPTARGRPGSSRTG